MEENKFEYNKIAITFEQNNPSNENINTAPLSHRQNYMEELHIDGQVGINFEMNSSGVSGEGKGSVGFKLPLGLFLSLVHKLSSIFRKKHGC